MSVTGIIQVSAALNPEGVPPLYDETVSDSQTVLDLTIARVRRIEGLDAVYFYAYQPDDALRQRLKAYDLPLLEGPEDLDRTEVSEPGAFSPLDAESAYRTNELARLDYLFHETGSEHLLLLHGDMPLLDPPLNSRLLRVHLDEVAEYSYGDEFPPGIVGEVLSQPGLQRLTAAAQTDFPVYSRRGLYDLVEQNRNFLFVEVVISEYDVALRRYSLYAADRFSLAAVRRLTERAGVDTDYDGIMTVIEEDPAVMRPQPVYCEIELTNRHPLPGYSSPAAADRRGPASLTRSTVASLIGEIESFSDRMVIGLGGAGDPLSHPDFYGILSDLLGSEAVPFIIVETHGGRADAEYRQFVAEKGRGKVLTVFRLDAYTPEQYAALHGEGDFAAIDAAVREYMTELPRYGYIQYTRMKGNEETTHEFFRYWERVTPNVILVPFNTYGGQLEARNVSDLSPLNRFGCYHLARYLSVSCAGHYRLCRVDVNDDYPVGEAGKTPLLTAWQTLAESFRQDWREPGSAHSLCAACGEWYNFYY
jgi:spiro-SPASM protein